MSKDRGYLRTLSCSISLSSCRVRAEALARSLNSRLWSRAGLAAASRRSHDPYERLLTENAINNTCAGMANVVDKPPGGQESFTGSDLKEIKHCWVNEMAVDEDELFDTPPCSSPPSPADEEIIVNPPSPLPFCTKFLRDFNATNSEFRAGCSKDANRRAVFPDEVKLRDKLQQYADGLLATDEGCETFYDACDGDRKNECSDFVRKCSPDCKADLPDMSSHEFSTACPSDSLASESNDPSSNTTGEKPPEKAVEDNPETDAKLTDVTSFSEVTSKVVQEPRLENDVDNTDANDVPSVESCDESSGCNSLVPPDLQGSSIQEVEEEGRPRLLRSTSLKTGKTPPSTPGRKKIVRFADVLGLDLEAVRHIVSEDLPNVPSSAFKDLKLPPDEDDKVPIVTSKAVTVPTTTWKSVPTASGSVLNNLFPLFRPPGGDHDFLDRVRRNNVCLEAITVSVHSVHVVCRVLNISFEKQVLCRYTTDNWRTMDEVSAAYVPFSSDGEFDRFAFSLFLPGASGTKDDIIFAIRYTANNRDYWDNNEGQNYTLRYHCTGGNGALIIPEAEEHPPWLHHFF